MCHAPYYGGAHHCLLLLCSAALDSKPRVGVLQSVCWLNGCLGILVAWVLPDAWQATPWWVLVSGWACKARLGRAGLVSSGGGSEILAVAVNCTLNF